MLPAWWDWDLSARARLASLASAWVLVAFAWAPAAIILPIAAARFGTSLVQTLWNHQLDGVHPLGSRNLLDWAMFATAMAMSITVAALDRAGTTLVAPFAFSLILAPLSVIQLKAALRSFEVHRQVADRRRVVALRVVSAGAERRAA